VGFRARSSVKAGFGQYFDPGSQNVTDPNP